MGQITGLAWSGPDTLLATSFAKSQIAFVSVDTGSPRTLALPHNGMVGVRAAAYDADSHRGLFGTEAGAIFLLKNDSQALRWDGKSLPFRGSITSVAIYKPAYPLAAAGGAGGNLILWDEMSKKRLWRASRLCEAGSTWENRFTEKWEPFRIEKTAIPTSLLELPIAALSWQPNMDGRQLLFVGCGESDNSSESRVGYGGVLEFGPTKVRQVWLRRLHDGILAAAWRPDGKYLATAGRDGLIKISTSENGDLVSWFRVQSDFPVSVSWNGEGTSLAVGTNSGLVIVLPFEQDLPLGDVLASSKRLIPRTDLTEPECEHFFLQSCPK